MAQNLTKGAATIEQPIGDIVPGWTPRARPDSKPEYHHLQGQYCRLELLNSNSNRTTIEQLYEVFKPTEKTHFTYLGYGPFETIDQFIEFICMKELPRSNSIFYSIIVNDRAVGFISYLRIKEKQGAIEIGHVNFSQQLVHTRQGTERVEWSCNALNAKSRQAALRLGFQYEGTWIKSDVSKGRSRDNSWYSISDDEWPTVKQELQRWLNKDNFDVNGQQLTKLNAAQVNPRTNKTST